MTLKQMEYFLSVSETLNFAKTAELLYTTQPSVSRQIRALEEELGVTLFYRHSRKVELTRVGFYLNVEFQRVMRELKTAVENARKLETQLAEAIRIGVCNLDEVPCLPKAMRIFNDKYPTVQIELCTDSFQNIVQAIRNDELDVGCCMRSPATVLNGIEQRLLRKGSFYCIVPTDSPLRMYERIFPEQICGYPWIFRNQKNSTPAIAHLQHQLREHWPDNPILYSASPAQSALMVKAGFGISIVVSYSVEPGPDFVMIPFEVPEEENWQELDLIVFWKGGHDNRLSREFGMLACQIQQELDGEREITHLWPECGD